MATYEIILANFRIKVYIVADSFAEAIEKWKSQTHLGEESIRSITVL